MKEFPLDVVRQATSAVNNKMFFNSAGSSLPSDKSIQKIKDYMDEEAIVGGYGLMEKMHQTFEEFYSETAKLINAKAHNIAFAQSATVACSQALYSIEWKKGEIVLTSNLEYVSNLLSLYRLKERFGLQIVFVDSADDGLIDMNSLEDALKEYTPRALMLTHIPTNTGVIQDAVKAGELCEKYECIYILDACQSVGHINVDVHEINCDFLSVTGRKYLRGPRGSGFLYVSDKWVHSKHAPLCIDLAGANWTGELSYEFHQNARRWEMWEKNYSILLGLTQSIKEINDLGIGQIEAYNSQLQKYYRKVLTSINGLNIKDESENNCSIITWRYKDLSRQETKTKLDQCGVVYSMAMKESALIDMKKKGIDWSVRFSPHYFNSMEEIELFKSKFVDLVSS